MVFGIYFYPVGERWLNSKVQKNATYLELQTHCVSISYFVSSSEVRDGDRLFLELAAALCSMMTVA